MRTDFRHLLIKRDGHVISITMDRPEVLNAFNDLLVQELIFAMESAAADETVRCVILKGAGRAFGAGQDLAVFVSEREKDAPVQANEHLQRYHYLINAIRGVPKPVIASVHGVAAGISLNIALACDLRIASEDARFTQAFARIGLVPDGGGAYFLPRLIGLGKAMEMVLLADDIKGSEAERLGLVNKCVPLADLEATTLALAQRLAQGPTQTYGLIKELMYTSQDKDLQGVFDLEEKLQEIALGTADHREGVEAFLQKRTPKYTGK